MSHSEQSIRRANPIHPSFLTKFPLWNKSLPLLVLIPPPPYPHTYTHIILYHLAANPPPDREENNITEVKSSTMNPSILQLHILPSFPVPLHYPAPRRTKSSAYSKRCFDAHAMYCNIYSHLPTGNKITRLCPAAKEIRCATKCSVFP
jgi:hypothetical protein